MAEKKEEKKLSDLPGIGPAAVEKLESAGIFDLMGIAVLSPKELSEMAGLGEAVARKAIQAARKMMKLDFSDGLEFAKKREEVSYITTGSKNLDVLLGGRGVETRAMTEAFGAYGSGKCVSKDTLVSYFNDSKLHVETIQDVYGKYKNNETRLEEGFIFPVDKIKVMAFINDKIKIIKASHLYREKVKKILLLKTKRGRILKVTGNHQLLSFNDGILWERAKNLQKGDVISYPKEFNLENEYSLLTADDSYFLGFFVAEGTRNPFSVCNSNKFVIEWIKDYVQKRFNYLPTIRTRVAKEGSEINYTLLLRNLTKEIMFGLEDTDSSTKFIPEAIFNSPKDIVASFLTGYLEGDGEITKDIVSATTKSKRLVSELSYLFLRLGISSTLKIRNRKGKEFFVVSIVGEDRLKINNFPFKFKKVKLSIINSKYGIPRQIVSFIRKAYKETIGGNRGRQRKEIGKRNSDSMSYRHFTHNELVSNINSKTFDEIENLFLNGKRIIEGIIFNLSNEVLSTQNLREIFVRLPFAFNSLAEKLNIRKSSIRNYNLRKLPEHRKEVLKKVMTEELIQRKKEIENILQIINKLKKFNWDSVEEITEIDYDDYVYDFVVPEGHSFVGGNLPTIMHNSQLGFALAVNVQLPCEMGGADGKAVYIDSEGTFRPERIKQIATAAGANPEKILKNIFVARAMNSDHQILLIDKIGEMIKNGEPIKLIIIDSLTAHFRAEFTGRGQLADRQQKLNKYLHNLMKIAEQYNLAVYLTNQVMANPAMMFGDPTTAVGGHIVGHAAQFRLYLRRGKKDSRVAKMIDSPNLPESETVFFITKGGLRDEAVEGD